MADGTESYGFIAATRFDRRYQDAPNNLRSADQFGPIVNAYAESMNRVMSIPVMLAQAVFVTNIMSRAAGPVPLKTGVAQLDVAASNDPEAIARFDREMELVNAGISALSPEQSAELTLNMGGTIIEHLCESEVEAVRQFGVFPVVYNGVASMYYTMVANSYAAFETLASDLWVEAVNRYSELAEPFFNLTRDLKPKPPNDSPKVISYDALARYGFDVSNRMGTYLKDERTVRFGKVGGVRAAYDRAFKGLAAPIFDANPSLYLTEQIRHVIAHSSGRADADFLTDEAVKGTKYASLQPGEHVRLKGEDVCGLIDPCVLASVALIELVDGWVANRS